MSLSLDEVLPFCDDCIAKAKTKGLDNLKPKDLCTNCRQSLKHFCWCCMTVSNKGVNADGLCPDCVKWLDPKVIPEVRYAEAD